MRLILLHLSHRRAVRKGHHRRALEIMEQILMADFTAFDAALARVATKVQDDAAALATANAALAAAQADAVTLQGEIDNRTAQLDAIAPEPAPADAAPADAAPADAAAAQPAA